LRGYFKFVYLFHFVCLLCSDTCFNRTSSCDNNRRKVKNCESCYMRNIENEYHFLLFILGFTDSLEKGSNLTFSDITG
jgi:hypothetical protein